MLGVAAHGGRPAAGTGGHGTRVRHHAAPRRTLFNRPPFRRITTRAALGSDIGPTGALLPHAVPIASTSGTRHSLTSSRQASSSATPQKLAHSSARSLRRRHEGSPRGVGCHLQGHLMACRSTLRRRRRWPRKGHQTPRLPAGQDREKPPFSRPAARERVSFSCPRGLDRPPPTSPERPPHPLWPALLPSGRGGT
jgi:hypothetical protein